MMPIWKRAEYVRIHGDPSSDYARMMVFETFGNLAWCKHLDSGRMFLVEENTMVAHPILRPGEEFMVCEVVWVGGFPKALAD